MIRFRSAQNINLTVVALDSADAAVYFVIFEFVFMSCDLWICLSISNCDAMCILVEFYLVCEPILFTEYLNLVIMVAFFLS
jgi:hypothetical protein